MPGETPSAGTDSPLRLGLLAPGVAPIDQRAHADAGGVPAGGAERAIDRGRARRVVDMKRLRIIDLCEGDDRLAGEFVAAEPILRANDEVLVEPDHRAASAAARRPIMATFFWVMTVAPS